jgi:hypothetical protein
MRRQRVCAGAFLALRRHGGRVEHDDQGVGPVCRGIGRTSRGADVVEVRLLGPYLDVCGGSCAAGRPGGDCVVRGTCRSVEAAARKGEMCVGGRWELTEAGDAGSTDVARIRIPSTGSTAAACAPRVVLGVGGGGRMVRAGGERVEMRGARRFSRPSSRTGGSSSSSRSVCLAL